MPSALFKSILRFRCVEMARPAVWFPSPGKGVGVGDATTSTHRLAFRGIGVVFPTTLSGVLCPERDNITAPCLCTSTSKFFLYRLPDRTALPVPTPAPPHQRSDWPHQGRQRASGPADVLLAPGGKADPHPGLGGVEDASEIDGFDQVIRKSHSLVLLLDSVRWLADPLRKL